MATYVLTHPETGHEYSFDYTLYTRVTDHRGISVPITDWHILHPDTIEAMGVSKPLEIVGYLYDLRQHLGGTHGHVHNMISSAIYFLTDSCLSTFRSSTRSTSIDDIADYMMRYTYYRASYHLWTRVWLNSIHRNGASSVNYSGILEGGTTGGETPRYKLHLYSTYLEEERISTGSSSFEPSCGSEWRGRQSYSFKMDKTQHNFFRHEANEFYDPAYPQVGVPMFGLELEVSTSLHTDELQYIVCDVEPKQEPFFIMKDDSSITGSHCNKMEIVTVPASPRYLKKAFSTLFAKLEKLCARKGKTMSDLFDLSTDLGNGIHIHIDRRSFHSSKRKSHISRFLAAFNLGDEVTASLFSQISRRPGDYRTATYCSVDRHLQKYTTGYKLKEAASSGHRGCTSMRQSSTVEVRVFQGIVDINHIRSCIEATQAMLEYTHMMPLSTLNRKFAPGFREFVLKSGQFNNLRKELK